MKHLVQIFELRSTKEKPYIAKKFKDLKHGDEIYYLNNNEEIVVIVDEIVKSNLGRPINYFRDELSDGQPTDEKVDLKIYFTTGETLNVRGDSSWFSNEKMNKIIATNEKLLYTIKKEILK